MIITQQVYDGSLIHDRFAYKFYRKNTSPIGNIVAFVAPMDVTTNLIDLEDTLANDYIHSEKAINFCWEINNLDRFGAVCFQRYFNTKLAEILTNIRGGLKYYMKGDDILVDVKNVSSHETATQKASVSITYSKDNVSIGHTGINVIAGKRAPSFAHSTYLDNAEVEVFMTAAMAYFDETIADIALATTKVVV
jgi:hypothetical protein